MRLSAAEKQQRYREKLKASGRYNAQKESDRKRHAILRARLSHAERENLRRKNRESKQKERDRKGGRLQMVDNNDDSQAPVKFVISPESFSTRQSHEKAKKRVLEALTKSPSCKKTALVNEIASNSGLAIAIDATPYKRSNRLNEDVMKNVDNFYNTDEISWQAPGICDFTLHEWGQKQRVQKRYLLMTLKEAHSLFCLQHPQAVIGFSKFADLRPPHVLLQKNIPQSVYVCKTYENVRLLLKSLSQKGVEVEMEFKDFISQIVCDQEKESCMSGKCTSCPGIQSLVPAEDDGSEICTWSQWVIEDHVEKRDFQGTVRDCFEELEKAVPSFLEHTFVKMTEAATFKDCEDNLKPGAKARDVLVLLSSTAGTGISKVLKRPRLADKLVVKLFDRKVRRHVLFREIKKIKSLKG